ncbi:MAG: serine hydrolase domain-containing protein [Verrucomicrobiota bacterium]
MNLKPLFLFFFLSGLVVPGWAQQRLPKNGIVDQSLSPVVEEAVSQLLEAKKLAGAVTLVAQEGKVRHLQAHGLLSLDSDEPVKTNSIFRIHSMTKAIVSAAALQQLELGKYQLNDPVAKFIPAFEKLTLLNSGEVAKRSMTVADLFRHTSGLAYGFTAPPELVPLYSSPKLWGGNLKQFCNHLATIPLVHEPGESWTYGVSTDVLGRLVEIWSGEELDQYLDEEFFQPLGMENTGFWIEDKSDFQRFAKTHMTTVEGINVSAEPWGKQNGEKPKLLSGGGGLVSTAEDYYQFLQMIVDGGMRNGHTFLKPETVTLMTSDQLPDKIANIFFGQEQRYQIGFGLGFSVVKGPSKDWDEAAALAEFGWGGAASCHYWVSPNDSNLIVITLEQTMPYNWNMEWTLKPLIYDVIRGTNKGSD